MPINLELSKKSIIFNIQNDSNQLEIADSLELSNKGNIPVKYKWVSPERCPFRIEPSSGTVEKFGTQRATVKYKPTSSRDNIKLKLEVAEGVNKILECVGSTMEVKVELSRSQINFNHIPVCQRVHDIFYIINRHKKNTAYYQIEKDKFAEGFEIKPLSGKIKAEDRQKFEISFFSSVVTDIKQRKIPIDIRGSRQLNLLVSVVTQVPRIEILESVFDFGQITYGNKGQLQMTLTNTCSIQAQVELDLSSSNENTQEKLDCLDIEQEIDKHAKGPASLVLKKISENGLSSSSAKHSSRKYVMIIYPFKTYIFKLSFVPMKPKMYKFELPIRISGYGKTESLKRDVFCQGINPKIILDPLNGVVEFPKKVITSSENVFPETRFIVLSNPSAKRPIVWSIDTGGLSKDNIFSVMPSSGIINPKVSVSVKIQFKPVKSMKYNLQLPIHIDKEKTPYNHLTIRAEGAAPCLLFETTDMILPTVPLNTESSSRFVIINDGYIKTHLSHTIAKHVQDTDFKVTFVNGNHLNASKNLCIVEISFVARAPVSFTTRIDFEDNNKKAYSITVSGTADNFLFSNFFPGMSKSFSLKKSERNKMELYGLGIFQSESDQTKSPSPPKAGKTSPLRASRGSTTTPMPIPAPRNPPIAAPSPTRSCRARRPRTSRRTPSTSTPPGCASGCCSKPAPRTRAPGRTAPCSIWTTCRWTRPRPT